MNRKKLKILLNIDYNFTKDYNNTMKINCKIKECFAMTGDNDSCNGTIDLINQEIIKTEYKEFSDPDDCEAFLGRQYFEVEFKLFEEEYQFEINKTIIGDVFEIKPSEKEKFTKLVSALLMKENLDNNLPEKNTIKMKSKI